MLAMMVPHQSAAMFLRPQPGTPVTGAWSSGIANPGRWVKAILDLLKRGHQNLSVWFHQPPVLPRTHLQDQHEVHPPGAVADQVHPPGAVTDQVQLGRHPEVSHPQAVRHHLVEIRISRFAISRGQ